MMVIAYTCMSHDPSMRYTHMAFSPHTHTHHVTIVGYSTGEQLVADH